MAENSTGPSAAPLLLLLKGHPGSGKTTLGRELARRTGWCVADKDDAKDVMVSSLPDVPDSLLNPASYQVMFRVAATQLAVGGSVIADCPLSRRYLYDQALELAAKYNAQVAVVECLPSKHAVWRQRLEQRAAAERGTCSDHKPQSWEQLCSIIAKYEGADRWTQQHPPEGEEDSSLSSSCCAAVQHFMEVDTSLGDTAGHVNAVLIFLLERGLMPQPHTALQPDTVSAAAATAAVLEPRSVCNDARGKAGGEVGEHTATAAAGVGAATAALLSGC